MKNRFVTLKSFLRTERPKEDTCNNENYWRLIGEKGEVIDDDKMLDKVLVLFSNNLDDYGLENHNPVKNSLWIRKSDLKFDEE